MLKNNIVNSLEKIGLKIWGNGKGNEGALRAICKYASGKAALSQSETGQLLAC